MIDDLEVIFPYDYIYPEQYAYMRQLKNTLTKGHCLLEMPTGTGKTVTLLSFILSFQYKYTKVGKLIYCTRTVQEMDKVVEELRFLMTYRQKELKAKQDAGEAVENPNILGVCLSSRRNMCIHPVVSKYDNPNKVDAMCRNLTASFILESKEQARAEDKTADIETCEFYAGYQRSASDALSGVYGLQDMKEMGRQKGWCPYFVARRLINLANVVVYNYQYMLDPKISSLVSKEIDKESIVVFDEAHNIDNICIEALSVQLDKRTVQASSRNIQQLQTALEKLQATDAERLNQEYKSLVQGLAQSGNLNAEVLGGSPILPADILREAVPGNIRRAKHFIMFMRTIVEYFKSVLKGKSVSTDKPPQFVLKLQIQTRMQEVKALKFCYDRLNSLLKTLQIKDLDQYTPIQKIANFATVVSTYTEGFVVIMEPVDDRTSNAPDPKLLLCCLDASLAIKPVFERFASVVITSGTLSPLTLYPRLLNFTPVVSESFQMSLTRNCICPMVVTKGSDQVPISSKFEARADPSVVINYGRLLLELAAIVPDGLVCFFVSYEYMEDIVSKWDQGNPSLLSQMVAHKLIFIETKDVVETTYALQNFKKACDSGRGAIFLSVARGKVAEGVDFDRHYGRCVVMFGIPFQYTRSRVLLARLEYLREKFNLQDGEFLSFDALRQTSQCVGRVIRSKTDYGLMIFADMRYSRADKRNKLPQWITQFMTPDTLNLSTDRALTIARDFLKQMAQPHNRQDELGITMLNHAQVAAIEQEANRKRKAAESLEGR